MKIQCDTSGCTNDAEWKDQKGNRWCDSCKRDIADYERTLSGAHYSVTTVFRREAREVPNS